MKNSIKHLFLAALVSLFLIPNVLGQSLENILIQWGSFYVFGATEAAVAPGKLEWSSPITVVSESGGPVTLTVGRLDGSDGAVSVDYTLGGDIATGGAACSPGVDYINIGGTLNFAPGQTSQSISVVICSDTVDEFNERFVATLSNPTGGATIGTTANQTVSITDDDNEPTVSISDVTQVEGSGANSSFVFTVSLSAPAGRWSTISCDTANGTATAGTDYTLISGGIIVFNEGEMTKQVAIVVNPDARVEPDETFTLNLFNPSFMTIVDGQGVGTILNDDIGGNVQFSAASYNIAENVENMTVTVTRANGNASDIVVQYASVSGTAAPGQDYTQTAGSVTFDANQTTKTFTVPIINDTLDEETESFNLTITGVAGGATIGAPSAATVNIEDDDLPPAMSINNNSVSEPDSGSVSVNVPVSLASPSGREVRVDFTTVDGTATASTDYLAVSGQLVFAPGETSKTISVSVLGDTRTESDESFQIKLSNPVNTTIGNDTAIITIINNDTARTTPVADFDGDGQTDISIFRPASGEWWYARSSNEQVSAVQFGQSTDRLVPADFTGDGKTDITFWRPSNGLWFILRSEDNTFFSFPFGANGDLPVSGDFDADGKADPTVYRPSTNEWFISKSTGGTSITTFGAAGDVPVAADFDGDGKTDIAVYRLSSGEWWIRRSTNASVYAFQFGTSTDKPVPGDYTGDGKADSAFWRPASGEWFILRSEDSSFYSVPFGANGDVPVPGDYDGDGQFDTAVFRPSGSTWFINRSTAGILITNFGAAGDQPLPNVFVPQ